MGALVGVPPARRPVSRRAGGGGPPDRCRRCSRRRRRSMTTSRPNGALDPGGRIASRWRSEAGVRPVVEAPGSPMEEGLGRASVATSSSMAARARSCLERSFDARCAGMTGTRPPSARRLVTGRSGWSTERRLSSARTDSTPVRDSAHAASTAPGRAQWATRRLPRATCAVTVGRS